MNELRSRTRTRVLGLAAALGLLAGGVAVGAALTAATVTGSGRAAAPATRAAALGQPRLSAQARVALLRYLREGRPVATLVRPGGLNIKAGSNAATALQSYNWSGYADHGAAGSFTAVSAIWRQPATFCGREQRLTATWVGLDGFDNQTVEQDGTLAYCFEGAAYYFTWWEMFPGGSVTVGSSVRPGDLISASVSRSGTSYTLAVKDASTPANSFSTVQSCTSCQNDSAEWIAERPAFPIGVTPLSTFTTWNLVRGSQTSGGTTGSIGSGPGVTQITMIDATASYPLVKVSGLSRSGARFRTLWLNSY
jgi:Peptidase A4 family